MRLKRLSSPVIVLPLIFFMISTGLMVFWDSNNLHHITGDEPHYLVMADGLLPTFEFEQTGPYAREFRNRTISPFGLAPLDAVPNVDNTDAIPGPNGLFNIHNVGLPIILAIPYLFGGVLGARLALIAIGALAIALFAAIATSLGATRKLAYAVVLPFVLCLPFATASTQIYPDLPAGVILLLGISLLVLSQNKTHKGVLLLVSLCLSLLPWLHLKFSLALLIVLGAIFINRRTKDNEKQLLSILLIPTIISGALLLFYNKYAFNNFFGPYESEDVQATSFTFMQFFGLLSDQNQGIIIQQPLHLLGIFMIGRLVRERTNLIVTSLLVAVTTLGANATHWAVYGGWSFSGRFGWTAVTCFTVISLAALVSIASTARRGLVVALLVSFAVQLRYMFGLILEKKELLPHFTDSWIGTYSIFWNTFENALPRWTSTADAFSYFPNIVAVLFLLFLFGLGWLTFVSIRSALRLGAVAGVAALVAVSVFSVTWSPTNAERRWNGDQFQGQIGEIKTPTRTVSEPSPEGFLTFGPRWRTPVGSYSLTVFYAAANEPYKSVGVFDVFSPETGRVLTSVPMPRTAAEGQELTIQFDVTAPDAGQLEFRTFYEGEGTLTTWWVRITPL
jgi:hypothetical protein